MSEALSLYVHVPFCRSRCSYCDFYSTVYQHENAEKYIGAISRELAFRSSDRLFETVYIGGGTPSCMGPEQLESLLSAVRDSVDLAKDAEFTMEANPDTVDEGRLSIAMEYGVNRISLGVQSFHNEQLSLLGRRHSASQAERAIELTKGSGIRNLGVDLMFGIPGETVADWEADLVSAARCEPEHISTYCLSFEENTRLHQMLLEGIVAAPSQEILRQMMKSAMCLLPAEGYTQYEISNYAKPGFSCRHNVRYWQNAEFVGVGPSAVTYVGGTRRQNVKDLHAYLSIADWQASPYEYVERLDDEKRARETLFLGLRMREGVEMADFRSRTGYDIVELCGEAIARFTDLGLMKQSEGRLRLTSEGIYVADSVFSELV